jgi:hypothetical protein
VRKYRGKQQFGTPRILQDNINIDFRRYRGG